MTTTTLWSRQVDDGQVEIEFASLEKPNPKLAMEQLRINLISIQVSAQSPGTKNTR